VIIEILGWLCTLLVLVGFIFNANKKLVVALIIWIIGDVGWIIYDFYINNFSHATLSTAIILINSYGLYKTKFK
jgi:membrane-bound ClpP family serine protease